VVWTRTRWFRREHANIKRRRKSYKKLNRNNCGKTEDSADFSSINPYEMEMMLEKWMSHSSTLQGVFYGTQRFCKMLFSFLLLLIGTQNLQSLDIRS
jgi:hypothetical protein